MNVRDPYGDLDRFTPGKWSGPAGRLREAYVKGRMTRDAYLRALRRLTLGPRRARRRAA